MPTSVADLVGTRTWLTELLRWAESCPEATVLEDEHGRALTYAGLVDHAVAVKERLQQQYGVAPGHHIGFHLENGVGYVPLLVAVTALGAVTVPISTKLTASEVAEQVSATRLQLFITDHQEWIDAGLVSDVPVAPRTNLLDEPLDRSAALTARGALAPVDLDVDQPATIICTSGSTAAPKPIVLSHGNLMMSAIGFRSYFGFGPDDVGLSVFPWCHGNGHINQLITWLAAGMKIVIAGFTASGLPDQLQRSGATVMSLNGTHIKMVLARLPEGTDRLPSRLRMVKTALELDEATHRRFTSVFGVPLYKSYQQTECRSPITLCGPADYRYVSNANPIGYPAPAYLVRLVDEAGRQVEAGVPGEILVRCITRHGIALGHIDAESGELVRHERDSWWSTGDLAIADTDGFLYFAGRTKDMVKRAGYNVAVAEVEEIVRGHPAVTDAVIIGAPDPMREEMLVVFASVTPRGLTLEGLQEYCTQYLAPYKIPSALHIVDTVPRTELGKPDKKTLREWLA